MPIAYCFFPNVGYYITVRADGPPDEQGEPSMNKLTAKTIRQNFPADVAEHVLGLSARFSTRSIYFSLRPEFYVDEDRNFLTYSDGQWRQIESAGEWHGIGAGRVTCNRDVRIPAGGWVIAWGYVLGKVSINVYHNNGQAQVA